VPSNLLLHRLGARVWIARILVSWGIVAVLTGFVRTAFQLSALRFLPMHRPIQPPGLGRVAGGPEVGGLQHGYQRRAALRLASNRGLLHVAVVARAQGSISAVYRRLPNRNPTTSCGETIWHQTDFLVGTALPQEVVVHRDKPHWRAATVLSQAL
jgi:hypothetical protein